MSQTSYSINQSGGIAGQLYDIGPNDVVSGVDQFDASVPFGVALVQGTLDNECRLPSASADISHILGVSLLVQTKEQALGTGIVNYPKGSDISILRKGRAYVQVEEAVTPSSPVFVRFAAGTSPQLGAFRASADSATAAQMMSGVAYRSSAAAGGFAVIEFNLPA